MLIGRLAASSTLAVALVAGLLVAVPATAATTQTKSCVDGGGHTWTGKVTWGDEYTSSGVRKVVADYAGWTTEREVIPTDSAVRTYDGAGSLVQTLTWTGEFDYNSGASYRARNPLNPPSAPGRTRIVVALGVDGDGYGDCAMTFTQPSAQPSTNPPPAPGGGYLDVVKAIPGLTHYYPLNAESGARDAVGGLNGVNHGAAFATNGATLNGSASVELPDDADFSVASKGAISILIYQTVTDWNGRGGNREYIHWAGKGRSGAHEWTFRHYIPGGGGEASSRPKRTSVYHYNPFGGLGAGSYFQDDDAAGYERVIVATIDRSTITMWKNGVKRDSDPLSGYSIKPQDTASSVFLGTRGDGTGFMIGRIRRAAFFDRILTDAEIKRLYDERGRS